MKVLITGAAGRIGRELVACRPAGIGVEALIEPSEQHVPEYPWIRCDVTDAEKVMMAITCAEPDVVVHLAAMTDVDGCERDPEKALLINRDGTANVARACAAAGAYLIYMSTDYIFDGRRGPYAEDDDPNPVSSYGSSKLEGENAVKSASGESAIVRISVPFGVRREGTGHNFVSWLIDELAEGKQLRVVDDQFTTPAYMPELAEALWLMIEKRFEGVMHYGTSDRLSRYAMALEVCRIMGFDETLITPIKTADIGFAAERPLESGFITDRMHELLGRPPLLFRNALFRMIEETESR